MGCPLSKSDRCPGSQPEAASSSSSTDDNPGAYPTVNNFYANEQQQQRKLSCNRRMSAYNGKGACYASNITSPYVEPKMDELLIHSHQRKNYNYQNFNQMVTVDNYSTYDNRNDNPYYGSAWNENRAPSSVNSVLTRFSKRVKSRHFDQRLLAHYDIKSLIGKGSFSRVVSAQHRATKLPVAIKVVSTKHGDGPLENELRILSQLRHPNVIKLLDVYKTPSRVYMVMQIAMGGELYERIVKCGHYGEQETALTLQMILDGLCYLHRCHIAHRDLKPENLLYLTPARDSPLIITDFGLASQKATVDDPFMNEPCGTPEYIAPEILARVPYTNKVDVWAVGVLSYILLSGTMPFDDDNRTVMYRNILRGQYYFHYEYWSYISLGAKDFVATLLTVEPGQRPAADAAAAHGWLRAVLSDGQDLNSKKSLPKTKSFDSNKPSHHRTRSNRSVKSIARSDAGHRVDKKEVERLHRDPEVQKILHINKRPLLINYGIV